MTERYNLDLIFKVNKLFFPFLIKNNNFWYIEFYIVHEIG